MLSWIMTQLSTEFNGSTTKDVNKIYIHTNTWHSRCFLPPFSWSYYGSTFLGMYMSHNCWAGNKSVTTTVSNGINSHINCLCQTLPLELITTLGDITCFVTSRKLPMPCEDHSFTGL